MAAPAHYGHDIAVKLNEKLTKDNEGLLLIEVDCPASN